MLPWDVKWRWINYSCVAFTRLSQDTQHSLSLTRTEGQFRTVLLAGLKLWGNCVNCCKAAAYQWICLSPRGCWSLSQLHLGEDRVHPWASHQLIVRPSVSISGFCTFTSGFIHDMMNELNSSNLTTCGWSHAFLKWELFLFCRETSHLSRSRLCLSHHAPNILLNTLKYACGSKKFLRRRQTKRGRRELPSSWIPCIYWRLLSGMIDVSPPN